MNDFMNYIETGQIDFSEGHLKLFDQSMVMFPTTTYLNLYRKCTALGEPGRKIIYDIGYEQIKAVFAVYEKNYNVSQMNADEFIKLFGPSVLICGWGNLNYAQLKYNIGEKIIVKLENNPFAIMYKKLFKHQKRGVDDFLLGLFSGGFSCIAGHKIIGKETKCIAKGDDICEFELELVAD
ncbi:MAG: V4R domain-containing protein [archaeon]